MKKIIFFFFSFIVQMLFSLTSYAENFYITNYDVTLDVQKNRKVHVTEEIDVYFTQASHGIYRNIPISGKLYYDKGKKVSFKAKVSNITVNEENKVYTEGRYKYIKIGSPHRTIVGPKKYVIKYIFDMGNDKLKGNDEFYFNIIGTQWHTSIENVAFKVILPTPYEELDKAMGFSLGVSGISGYDLSDLKYSIVEDKVIIGCINRTLLPREGLTVRGLFPDEYFEKKFEINLQEILKSKRFLLSVIFLLSILSFFIWYRWGRDEKVIPVVSFYPPKNKNSAEIDAGFNGYASNTGLASLVLYLASKGYIQIEEDAEGKYTLYKLKDYEGKNSNERKLMIALFDKSTTVTIDELKKSKNFYKNCDEIIASLNRINKDNFEQESVLDKKYILLFLSVFLTFVIFLYVLCDYSFPEWIVPQIIVLFFFVITVTVFLYMMQKTIFSFDTLKDKKSNSLLIVCIATPIIWLLYSLCSAFFFVAIEDNTIEVLFCFICLFTSIMCLLNIEKRNKQGRLFLSEIVGFKQFLQVVEKHRLELLLEENPNYISEIIPYAYVLGVFDNIMPLVEELYSKVQIEWYKGLSCFSSISDFSNTMSEISKPSELNGGIVPSSSSGGRGGRGGRTGGGAGGGGGGSW